MTGSTVAVWIDLVLEGGELVRIECPDKFSDECHDSLTNAMKRGDWWSPERYDGCKAEYMGMLLNRVNMSKVVGML